MKRGPRHHILAVDDCADVLALLEMQLAVDDVRVTTASSSREGLEKARGEAPDLILLDVDLPDEDGLDLCRRLKDDPSTANIPVMFLTCATDVDTKVRGLDLGAIDYVTKPFHAAELRARVRSALRTKKARDLLADRAQLDALTGLWNRAYLDERLAHETATALRTGKPLSLAMIDLDHFKRANDDYGHLFGDAVLQRVGDLLARGVRAGDAACRYGGEELALVLPGTALPDAIALSERMRRRIEELELSPRGRIVHVTASIGVAELFDSAASHMGELVERADEALYAAKQSGRNCVRASAVGTFRTMRISRSEVA